MTDYFDYGRFSFPPFFGSEQMQTLYDLTLAHGLIERTFHNGDVQSYIDFKDVMEDAHIFGTICDGELVGFAWVNTWTGRSAAVHVCLWPTAPREAIAEMGRKFLKHILTMKDGEYRDSLFGMTPETYHSTRRYAEDIGMRRAGIIPAGAVIDGEPVGLAIYTIVRKDVE